MLYVCVINYHSAFKEKQNLEGKLKESKGYINKLEQRILQNPKGTSQSYLSTDYNTAGTMDLDDKDNTQLLQMIENQKYEIKLLTQALVCFFFFGFS